MLESRHRYSSRYRYGDGFCASAPASLGAHISVAVASPASTAVAPSPSDGPIASFAPLLHGFPSRRCYQSCGRPSGQATSWVKLRVMMQSQRSHDPLLSALAAALAAALSWEELPVPCLWLPKELGWRFAEGSGGFLFVSPKPPSVLLGNWGGNTLRPPASMSSRHML